MKKVFTIAILLLIAPFTFSQVYMEKQSRHRFAQLTLGVDFQSSFGGNTKYLDDQGKVMGLKLTNTFSPRIVIGGIHFWGHADFQIAIPLFTTKIEEYNQELFLYKGVETTFKYYPFKIQHNKLRPFIGTSLIFNNIKQHNNNFSYPKGPVLSQMSLPLLSGFTFNSHNSLIEFGITWNYTNQFDYYISRNQIATVNYPPIFTTLSYKRTFDTTIGAEKKWESGKTEKITNFLAHKGRLNGIYIGIGISSAFWLKQSQYNKQNRSYINKYSPSIMPDFTIGYYYHKPDINVAIAYRNISTSTDTYGANQELKRKSLLIEATKYLFDYHGFVPFVGPSISYENLSFKERYERKPIISETDQKLGYGITFGWDIRPNRIQGWLLRTNLRWCPNLNLGIEPNSKVAFDQIEFNFIQLIVFPNRLGKHKN